MSAPGVAECIEVLEGLKLADGSFSYIDDTLSEAQQAGLLSAITYLREIPRLEESLTRVREKYSRLYGKNTQQAVVLLKVADWMSGECADDDAAETTMALVRECRAAIGEVKTCVWSQEDDETDCWDTSCGRLFCLNEGGPIENNMKFCAFCGMPVEEVPWTEPADEEEEGR